MAGIGFELRKILRSEKITSKIKGFAYATVVSVGPLIISVFMIISIGQYMKFTQVSVMERDLVNTTILYAFVFAMIVVSGLSMTLSRYLADQIYLKKQARILPSLSGAVTILVSFSGLVCLIFFVFSSLEAVFKLLAYLLFIELNCIYLFMVYLSAVKDYKRITAAFGLGALLTIVLSVLLRALKMPVPLAVLTGLDIGLMVNMTFMLLVIKKHFGSSGKQQYRFMTYIKKMPLLFLTSFLYALGLFAHNFVFWLFSDLSVSLLGTFRYAPSYDNATFFAVLTIIPSSVLFVVRVETTFYERYRAFCQAVISGGSLKAVDMTKWKMISTLKKELANLFEIQFITTLIMIILGTYIILPAIGADSLTIGIYSILAIGYFFVQIMFITVTMLLYFDNQEDACRTMILFLAATVLLSVVSLLLGQPYFGLGLGIGTLVPLFYSVHRLVRMLDKVDYRLFSKPPYMSEAEVIGPSDPGEAVVAKSKT